MFGVHVYSVAVGMVRAHAVPGGLRPGLSERRGQTGRPRIP